MAVWERFLTETDKQVVAKRKRMLTPTGLGNRPALLLIDMQTVCCGRDVPIVDQLDEYPNGCGPQAWKAIGVQQTLLRRARLAGMPVIYSKHVFRDEAHLPRPAGDLYNTRAPASEIPVEIAMQPGDILIEKQRPSCFQFTNLPLILHAHGIDSLLVCGNSTSGCVRATCVDAPGFGIKVQVIEDATFDRIELSHAAALFDIQFKICEVISSADVLAVIDGKRATA